MKLYEFEAKKIVRDYGIPVPDGMLARNIDEAVEAAKKIGVPVVLKSQVLVGRRGLAGGIRIAETLEEVAREAENLFNTRIRGEEVKYLLIEEKIDFERELYLSITIDRTARKYVFLASPLGGIEIEELVKQHPDKLLKLYIDPATGYSPYMSRTAAKFLELPKDMWKNLHNIMNSMYKLMRELDAELVEFNPLAVTRKELIALDSKIRIDDNSLYRHPELQDKALRELSLKEQIAKKYGFSYVELDGNIGIICNGAGLTMATMDLVAYYGGKPANFLDIGGGATRERVKEAAKLILTHERVKVVLINIFGGITRCDEVARGVIEAVEETGAHKPIVVRMLGTNEEEGRRILEEYGYKVFSEADEAVKKAVELARR